MKEGSALNITLYTIHCPKCEILLKKLDSKNISYKIVDNKDKIIEEIGNKFFMPILKIDNTILEYKEAVDWINSYAS